MIVNWHYEDWIVDKWVSTDVEDGCHYQIWDCRIYDEGKVCLYKQYPDDKKLIGIFETVKEAKKHVKNL